jgi:hypothetical protein
MRSIMLLQNIIEWEPLHNGCCITAELIGSLVLPVAARSKAWVYGRSLAANGGFESRRVHRGLYVFSFVCCQVEVSATGRSLLQRSPTECGVSPRNLNNEETLVL